MIARVNTTQLASLPSEAQQPLARLLAVARWLATEGSGWPSPARMEDLADRLADAVGADLALVARVHPSILPPSVVSILGSRASREGGVSAEEASEAIATLLAPGAPSAEDQRFEFAPGGSLRFFLYAQPVEVGTESWGVIAFADRRGRPVADPNVADALRLIATQLAERLRPREASPPPDKVSRDELFRAAIDSLQDGIVVWDSDYRVAAYNQAWRSFVANVRPGEDLRGMSLIDIYREYVRSAVWSPVQADAVLRDILAGRSTGIRDRVIQQGGRHVRIRNYPIAAGGIVGVRSDVTDMVEREKQLMKAKEQAEVASRAKSTFLASVSHELRTPLNAIIGFSDVMHQEVFGPLGVARYREYIGDIHRSGTLLLSLINDILDMARVEAGKVELYFESFAIDSVVAEVMPLLKLRADAKDITLVAALEAGLPSVLADRRATTQILLNLVVNAVKFTPSGGKVDIRAARNGDYVEIAVIDNGPGIRKEDLVRLGRPFERLDLDAIEVAAENKGTGLGLAISRALAERQHGRLRIDSELGRGTTVHLRLPAVR
ncbi:MAG: PAS domain-containing sensor histidine kinase [Alphaproteobacteria bacterium]|nr:PAS domain-containing sensor histidine kinase [Alphaproteobacteria bacterium]